MASALAMALAEAGAVDLMKVAAWAEFFGGLRSGDVEPEVRAAIKGQRQGAAIDGDEAGGRAGVALRETSIDEGTLLMAEHRQFNYRTCLKACASQNTAGRQ
jgi:hypothetical protein